MEKTKKIISEILANPLWKSQLSNHCDFMNWKETPEELIQVSLAAFKKNDQGSLSFTATALRHKGYDILWGWLEIFEANK